MTDNGPREQRESTTPAEAKLRHRRELSRDSDQALTSAFELVLTPALFAFLGWRLDLFFGTSPLLLVVFFVFVLAYEVWKLYTRYEAEMRGHEQKLLGHEAQPDRDEQRFTGGGDE